MSEKTLLFVIMMLAVLAALAIFVFQLEPDMVPTSTVLLACGAALAAWASLVVCESWSAELDQ